jgi:TonB family protein
MTSPDKGKGDGGSVQPAAPSSLETENNQGASIGEAAKRQTEPAGGEKREMRVAGITSIQPSESIQVSPVETAIRIADTMLAENQTPVTKGVKDAISMEEPGTKEVQYELKQAAGEQAMQLNGKREKSETEIFTTVDQMPSFPGGEEALFTYLSDSLRYPQEAILQQIEGTVYVSFIVNTDGSLSDITILKGLGAGCDDEAIRLVKSMPNWKPGKNNDKNVRVLFNLPIKLVLP